MKDLPHHLKKLNRKILRAFYKEEMEGLTLPPLPPQQETLRELKKIKKRSALKARLERVPIHLTEDERNRKMKKRVPIFDKISHAKLRFSKPSKKKSPRI
jgi:hypothetical protein